MTLKFKLGLDFLTVHLPTESDHPTFNCSAVIVSTNKLTQTNRFCWKYPPPATMLCWWKHVQSYWHAVSSCSNEYFCSSMCLVSIYKVKDITVMCYNCLSN